MEPGFTLKTGEKIFKYVHLIMLLLMLLLMGFIFSLNSGEKRLLLVGWSVTFLALTFFRHYYLAGREKNLLYWIFPYLEGVLLYVINDVNHTALALIILIVMDIAIDYDYKYGVIYAVVGYTAYMFDYLEAYMSFPLSTKIMLFIIGGFQFSLFVGFAFLTRKYSFQSIKLRKATGELHAKMIDMEQMTLVKERNRIAGEIHNTVGHQLTTALIQIEATKMIMESDVQEAQKRLGIIKEQVREGLSELRKSIQAINAEDEYENFDEAIQKLLSQARTHGRIQVDTELENIEGTKLDLKKTLYHIILESITNAIRHGHCSKMEINLVNEDDVITLTSFNNGVVSKDFKYGYGLSHMKERIKELGGTLSITINDNGWFGLLAQLPIYYQEGDGHEYN